MNLFILIAFMAFKKKKMSEFQTVNVKRIQRVIRSGIPWGERFKEFVKG